MNLWAKKSLGRLTVLAVVLFFFSCEDETSLLGFRNPNQKFKVNYVEIPLTSSVLAIDSIITDNKAVTSAVSSVVLAGRYDDPLMGQVSATSFLQISAGNTTKLDPATHFYDSITVQFRLNFYGYGFAGEQEQTFAIHEITSDSLNRLGSDRYYYNDALQYDPLPLGEASVTVRYDSLRKQFGLSSTNQDTILISTRLAQPFGQRLFNLAATYDFSSREQVREFIYALKGLAVVPTGSNGIIGLRALDNLSRVTLHYHSEENGVKKDTLSRGYVFNYPSFSNITADRSVSELSAIMQPYQSFEPGSGLRHVQSGAPVVTKINLDHFYQFADQDSNKNVIINSAEFIIDDVVKSEGHDPHGALVFKIMNANDQFTNIRVTPDREAVGRYYVNTDANHYYINSDIPSQEASAASIFYESDGNRYKGFVTLFVQSLFKYRTDSDGINDTRINYLGLYPLTPPASTSVTRTVFNANNLKLRIYYTRPGGTNP